MHIYIHIPFCSSRCKYCKFAFITDFSELQKEFYVNFLIKSFKTAEKYFGTEIKTIYFGGGTPSILELSQIERISKELKKCFKFAENIEINFESTPIKLTKENLENYYNFGINRLSIGIESFNPETILEIGRKDNFSYENLKYLENSKIQNINFDFIIGLPYLKKGDSLKDIKKTLEEFPFVKHISPYMLENEFYPKNWKEISISTDEYLEEYILVKDFLEENGFIKYEISNFAKPGFESIHNKSYREGKEILAFGLGAHGFLEGKRYFYPNDFKNYYAGKITFEEISEEDKILEKIMFSLRTNGISVENRKYLDEEKISEFISDGFLEEKEGKICLTDKSFSVMDFIITKILI